MNSVSDEFDKLENKGKTDEISYMEPLWTTLSWDWVTPPDCEIETGAPDLEF